jgi:hypothetical protein
MGSKELAAPGQELLTEIEPVLIAQGLNNNYCLCVEFNHLEVFIVDLKNSSDRSRDCRIIIYSACTYNLTLYCYFYRSSKTVPIDFSL